MTAGRQGQGKLREVAAGIALAALLAAAGLGAAWAADLASSGSADGSQQVQAWVLSPLAHTAQGGDLAALWSAQGTTAELTLGSGSYVLGSDVHSSATLSVEGDVAIDLNGHALCIEPGASASTGISLGSGSLSVTDSSTGKGSLEIKMGRAVETASSAAGGYQGVAVTGGAAVELQGCALSVSYAGSSATMPAFSLSGIAVSKGSARLGAGAVLQVASAPSTGAYGASSVAGISCGKQAGGVDVDASARIEVVNQSRQLSSGSVDYPDFTGAAGAQSSSVANLLEFQPAPGSELERQLREAFLENAAYDGPEDLEGCQSGAGIYYATAMKLANGMTVWAYSNPVQGDDVGSFDKIVPAHVFMRAPVNEPQCAYGISADAAFGGSARVAGSISVQTGSGSAFALYQSTGGSWQSSGAQLSASCGGDPYVVRDAALDLRSIIEGIGQLPAALTYPAKSSFTLLRMASPQAARIAVRGSEPSAALAASDVDPARFFPHEGDAVAVSFSGMGGSGETVVAAAYGKTLQQAGAVVPSAPDYSSGGKTYRFVGWRLAGDSVATYARSAQAVFSELTLDSNVAGAAKGSVGFSAVYVPVAAGQHLVTFCVDGYVAACAVDQGKAPSFKTANPSAAAETPAKVKDVSGYSFAFKGWHAGADGESVWHEGEPVIANDALPAVSADSCYTARFERTVKLQKLVFSFWRSGDGKPVYSTQSISSFDWNDDALGAANTLVKAGDSFVYEGEEYTFLGWSVRMTDKEPYYSGGLPHTTGTSSNGAVNYYGVYSVKGKSYTVEFYVGDELYASAHEVSASTSIYSALMASSNPAEPCAQEEGVSFRGWNTSPKALGYLLASVVSVGSVAQADGSVRLYAIWKDANYPLVTFYDSDKATVIDCLEVQKGSSVAQSTGEQPVPAGENRDRFEGWADAAGNAFSCTETAVTEDIAVFATYTQLGTGTGTLEGGDADAETGGALSSNSSSGTVGKGGALKATTIKLDGGSSSKKGALAASSSSLEKAGEGGEDPDEEDGDESDDSWAAAGASESATPAGGSPADGITSPGEDAGNAAGFFIACALFLLLVAAAALWFARRRKEDFAEELTASTPGAEPALTQMRF
ncbi:MAG: hypothetical protein ACI36V_01430 [Coriobacteriales bacterium]